jgi:hypothetical protein
MLDKLKKKESEQGGESKSSSVSSIELYLDKRAARVTVSMAAKSAAEAGAEPSSRTVLTQGTPEWDAVDLDDDEAVARYRRRRKYAPARIGLGLGSLVLGGLGAGLGGLAGYSDYHTERKRSQGAKLRDAGLGALAGSLAGVVPYGIGRTLFGIGDWIEDRGIAHEQRDMRAARERASRRDG